MHPIGKFSFHIFNLTHPKMMLNKIQIQVCHNIYELSLRHFHINYCEGTS